MGIGFHSEDRAKQLDYLRQIARDIRFGMVGEGTPPEQVSRYCQENELPAWFDDHDLNLLVEFVRG
jgi:hypothetical protein